MTSKFKRRGMGRHTPGPWVWGENYEGLSSTEADILSFGEWEGMWLTDCQVGNERKTNERKANARLIAAAPELLEALKMAQSVLDQLRNPDMTTTSNSLFLSIVAAETKARAAIAKAESAA